MNWRHYTETLFVRDNEPGHFGQPSTKHTFGLRIFGRSLIVTWCWC